MWVSLMLNLLPTDDKAVVSNSKKRGIKNYTNKQISNAFILLQQRCEEVICQPALCLHFNKLHGLRGSTLLVFNDSWS